MKRDHDDMTGENGNSDNKEDIDSAIDIVPPYDATQEDLPQSPVFTPEYAQLLISISNAAGLLKEPLIESQYRDAVVEGLLEEVEVFTKCSFPEKVKVALVGDMKSGKSSVINSLLSVGIIARQGDAGCSCTWVVSEFSYLLPNQDHSFAAEVYFFPQEERYQIIAALFQSFYRACPKDSDPADGPKDNDQNVEDYGIMRTTVTVFRALFNNHREFSSDTAAHDFLLSAGAEDDVYILSRLYGWSDTLMAKTLGKDTCLRHGSNTVQGLTWDLAPCLSTVEERDGEPIISVWPFVRHVRYGLDCPLLKHNVTLVDLPGLSDANTIRVQNARNHLRGCTHYMVVAETGRAADDKFIREHLSQGFRTRNSGRTILVLTHADTMDDATEVQATSKDRQVLDGLVQEMKALEKQRSQLASKINNAKGMDKYEHMYARDNIMTELRAKRAKHREHRIGIRSRTIVTTMQQIYKQLTPDPLPLPVFCVGNHAYSKHQAGFAIEDSDRPSLSVLGTNIPALRAHLFLAPAEGRVNETKHQVNSTLPTLLNTFALYVAKTHMARKDEVEKVVLEPLQSIASCIDGEFRAIKKNVEDNILKPLRNDEYSWIEEAHRLCRQWAKTYSTSIHLAFLKKDGVRKGRGKGAALISWNDELVFISNGIVQNSFKEFIWSFDQIEKNITKAVFQMLGNLMQDIREDPQVALMALKPFLDYVWGEKGEVERVVKQSMRNLRKDVGQINNDAIMENINNPIVIAMLPVYASTREIKGVTGAPKLRLQQFENQVCKMGDGVFMQAHDRLQDELAKVLDNHCAAVTKVLTAFFTKIHRNFSIMCAEKEREDEDEARLRERLEVKLRLARELLETNIEPAYAACFAKE